MLVPSERRRVLLFLLFLDLVGELGDSSSESGGEWKYSNSRWAKISGVRMDFRWREVHFNSKASLPCASQSPTLRSYRNVCVF